MQIISPNTAHSPRRKPAACVPADGLPGKSGRSRGVRTPGDRPGDEPCDRTSVAGLPGREGEDSQAGGPSKHEGPLAAFQREGRPASFRGRHNELLGEAADAPAASGSPRGDGRV